MFDQTLYRANPTRWGSLVYVKNYLRSKRLSDLENKDKEVLWLKLFPPRLPRPFSCILVAGIYFPPGKTAEEEKHMIDYLTNCTDAVLKDNPSAGVLLAVDFNKLCHRNLCRRFNLKSLVRAPTRGK